MHPPVPSQTGLPSNLLDDCRAHHQRKCPPLLHHWTQYRCPFNFPPHAPGTSRGCYPFQYPRLHASDSWHFPCHPIVLSKSTKDCWPLLAHPLGPSQQFDQYNRPTIQLSIGLRKLLATCLHSSFCTYICHMRNYLSNYCQSLFQ